MIFEPGTQLVEMGSACDIIHLSVGADLAIVGGTVAFLIGTPILGQRMANSDQQREEIDRSPIFYGCAGDGEDRMCLLGEPKKGLRALRIQRLSVMGLVS